MNVFLQICGTTYYALEVSAVRKFKR